MLAAGLAPAWSEIAIARLLDSGSCPVCAAELESTACRSCGADLASPEAAAVWTASMRAAAALEERSHLRLQIPRTRPAAAPAGSGDAAHAGEPRSGGAAPAPVPSGAVASAPPRSDTTLQSVLAVAGAGLFAIAAVVFTFFNPDLADGGVRGLVTLLVTVVFLGAARGLGRRSLRFSSETVGALGMVFVALDVYALTTLTPAGVSVWLFAAIGTLVAGGVMAALSVRLRLRSWAGPSVAGLALVPAMLGAAGGASASSVGWLTTMACAMALVVLISRWGRIFTRSLTAEVAVLTLIQLGAAVMSLALIVMGPDGSFARLAWSASAAFAVIAVIARLSSRRAAVALWSFVLGVAAAAGGMTVALGTVESAGLTTAPGGYGWYVAALAIGPVAGFITVSLGVAVKTSPERIWTDAGALLVAGFAALPVIAGAADGALATLAGRTLDSQDGTPDGVLSTSLGATAGAAVAVLILGAHAYVQRVRRGPTWTAVLAAWLAVGVLIAATTLPHGTPWANAVTGVTLAVGAATLLRLRPRTRPALRLPLLVGAYAVTVLAATVSWAETTLGVAVAPAIVVTAAVLSTLVPPRHRWAAHGAAYAYALISLAAGIGVTGLGAVASASLTTSAAAVFAVVVTFARSVPARTWWAVLAVTSVPFAVGILQVVTERSGWTALSTALIFSLSLTLMVTRRPGLGAALRAVCGAVLVPALAVVIVCLGAQLLSISASPVTLPVIAVLAALGLPAAAIARTVLAGRGIPASDARLASLAIELSSLLTGAIAVGLALVRDAAGLPTALLVLVILAAGTGAAAGVLRRTMLWWPAAAAATGAVWVLWVIAGVDVIEPYTLPPALAAVVVGTVLHGRRDADPSRGPASLVAAGLIVAIAPSVVTQVLNGGLWRFAGLVAAGAVLTAVSLRIRPTSLLAPLRPIGFAAALVAGAAGAVQGARVGSGADLVISAPFTPFVMALAASALGGAIAAVAGAGLAWTASPGSPWSRSRWVLAPALVWLFAGTWPAIEREWSTIWGMWALMLAGLAAVVAISARRRTVDGILPPVWFVFALAFITAVVAWSPRDLRVEWFSLPLGVALLTAGALHLRGKADGAASLGSWPRGFRGSWRLLAPGIVCAMSASIVATFTDPLTWRAILVIVMALVAILIGARARLAAPFVLGIVVLPIENVSAFAVQIGRGIESMPWWITLAVVGAVLLILAVTYERRAGETEGIAARLRDLR